MNIVICDDNKIHSETLHRYLLEFYEKYEMELPRIDIYDSGEELLSGDLHIDIAFVDIEMSGISGIDVSKILKTKNKRMIIFIVTSYSQYLDDAMRADVFRYISKPVDKKRLFKNYKDALNLYNSISYKISINTGNSIDVVYTSDIIFIENNKGKTYIQTVDKRYESSEKLQYWINRLPENIFFRTHRSYYINLGYVSRFCEDMVYLYNNTYEAYLTKRKYYEFKNVYLFYLESMR